MLLVEAFVVGLAVVFFVASFLVSSDVVAKTFRAEYAFAFGVRLLSVVIFCWVAF